MADRSARDVIVQPVRLMPSRESLSVALLVCQSCNVMPTDEGGHLLLSMVTSPDRAGTVHEHLFLGPVCAKREVERYVTGVAPQ